VLACLRHHAVVGHHQQQRVADAGGAGQHGVHQAPVGERPHQRRLAVVDVAGAADDHRQVLSSRAAMV
jgi:hypothetical protein